MDKVVITKDALIVNSSKGSLTIDPNKVIAVTTVIEDDNWRYLDQKPYQETDSLNEPKYSVDVYYCSDGCSIQVKCSDEQEMNYIYSQIQQCIFGYSQQPVSKPVLP